MSDNEFLTAVNRIADADNHVFEAKDITSSTGVAFIDLALQKILPTDLVLIGAKTGVGKTQIMSHIAGHMSQSGKKVLFIALEAEDAEIEMRLRYQLLVALIKEHIVFADIDLSYRNFRHGGLCDEMLKFGNQVDEQFVARYKNLYTIYPKIGYTVADLEKTLIEAKEKGIEAIFLDHIHFMETLRGDEGNDSLTEIIKGVRRLNLNHNIPVFAAAHLRKDFERMIPTTEDFHGTSNLSKVATICLLIAKDPEGFDPVSGLQKTYFFLDKARTGSFGNMVGVQWFSTEDNRYTNHVGLGWATPDYKEVNLLDRLRYPKWANRKTIGAHILDQRAIDDIKDS